MLAAQVHLLANGRVTEHAQRASLSAKFARWFCSVIHNRYGHVPGSSVFHVTDGSTVRPALRTARDLLVCLFVSRSFLPLHEVEGVFLFGGLGLPLHEADSESYAGSFVQPRAGQRDLSKSECSLSPTPETRLAVTLQFISGVAENDTNTKQTPQVDGLILTDLYQNTLSV